MVDVIRKALLESLMGRTVKDAELLVKAYGHTTLVKPFGTREAPTDVHPPNTVILWQEPEGIVRMAQAGIAGELDSIP